MLGAYIAYFAFQYLHLDPFLSLPLAMAALFVLGYFVQLWVINRVLHYGLVMTLVITFGIDLFLTNLALVLFSADFRSVVPAYAGKGFAIFGAMVPYVRAAVFVAALVVTWLLSQFLSKTRLGLAIRATALHREAAELVGVTVRQVYAVTYRLAAAIAAAAGVMVSMLYSFNPQVGSGFLTPMFTITVLGGLGSIPGAVVGGLVMGLVESVVTVTVGPNFSKMLAFSVLVMILVLRPQGLLGKRFYGGGEHMRSALRAALPWIGVLAALLTLVVPALGPSGYMYRLLSTIFLGVTVAQGMNLMIGYANYPSLGNVVFYGIGAYTVGTLMTRYHWPFFPSLGAAMLVSALAAAVVGLPVLRLRGAYFSIATIAVNEAVRELVIVAEKLTGGAKGMTLPFYPGDPHRQELFFYYLTWGLAALSTTVVYLITLSRLGYGLRALKSNEDAARVMGVNTVWYKTIAWSISAALTGMAGAAYAYWISFLEPAPVFDIVFSVKYYIVAILGGAGTILGPVVGAFFFDLISELVWSRFLSLHMLVLGLTVVVVVLFLPKGFAPLLVSRASRPTGTGGEVGGRG